MTITIKVLSNKLKRILLVGSQVGSVELERILSFIDELVVINTIGLPLEELVLSDREVLRSESTPIDQLGRSCALGKVDYRSCRGTGKTSKAKKDDVTWDTFAKAVDCNNVKGVNGASDQ